MQSYVIHWKRQCECPTRRVYIRCATLSDLLFPVLLVAMVCGCGITVTSFYSKPKHPTWPYFNFVVAQIKQMPPQVAITDHSFGHIFALYFLCAQPKVCWPLVVVPVCETFHFGILKSTQTPKHMLQMWRWDPNGGVVNEIKTFRSQFAHERIFAQSMFGFCIKKRNWLQHVPTNRIKAIPGIRPNLFRRQ